MEVRKARDEDESAIRELFGFCFGRTMSAEEWRWKYRESPWGSMATVAVHEGRIIAHYGGIRMMFRGDDRRFTVFEPCDVMTHPDYRSRFFSRRGAMVQAAELFYQSAPMDFAFGFASERHSVLGARLLGYTEHRYVDVLEKDVTDGERGLPLTIEARRGWDGIGNGDGDALWESSRMGLALSIEKGNRYLKWRYQDNPIRRYEALILRNRFLRKQVGLIIFRKEGGVLNIMDHVFSLNVKEDRIARYFIGAARLLHAGNVRLWMNRCEPLHKIFGNAGFRGSQGVPLVFKIFNESFNADVLVSSYNYGMGDYDAA